MNAVAESFGAHDTERRLYTSACLVGGRPLCCAALFGSAKAGMRHSRTLGFKIEMKFSDVKGQDHLKEILRRNVDEGRVSHAQMFSGRSGFGTLPLALAYVQYLNCTARRDGDSCGVCPSCVKMEGLVHPDLHFVFPVNSAKGGAQKPLSDSFLPQWREMIRETGGYFDEQMWYAKIGLDNQQGLIAKREADEIIRKLSFKAFEARYKTVLVWLPEKMGTEAANGLLKILEEPWEGTLFILVSAVPGMLLPTVLSRVQEINVAPLDTGVLSTVLVEKYGMSSEEAPAAAHIAGGDIIELSRLTSRGETAPEDFENFAALMRYSYNDRHLELFGWAEAMALQGREAQKRFLKYTAAMLRESYMIASGMGNISYLWGRELDFCTKFAPFVNAGNIERLIEENRTALLHISQNGNARIVLTHYALSVSKLIGMGRK